MHQDGARGRNQAAARLVAVAGALAVVAAGLLSPARPPPGVRR